MIFTLSDTSLTMFIGGKPYAVANSHHNWDKLMGIITGKTPYPVDEELIKMLDIRQKIQTNERIRVDEHTDNIMVDGKLINSYLTQKIIKWSLAGIDVQPWLNFLDKLLKNPSKQVYDELFLWMEASNLPIHPDGDFLAYKRVQSDYTSFHASPDGTHQFHPLGEKIEMPRIEVDDRRDYPCSSGFHFASYDYAKNHYHSGKGRMIILKINPADVVSIPNDYNNQKGRATGYIRVDELKEEYVDELKDMEVWKPGVKVGDFVVCLREDSDTLIYGELYEVVSIDNDGSVWVDDSFGNRQRIDYESFVTYDPEIKIGDTIVCLKDGPDLTANQAYTVQGVTDDEVWVYDDVGETNYPQYYMKI